jgi:hypothetical protein
MDKRTSLISRNDGNEEKKSFLTFSVGRRRIWRIGREKDFGNLSREREQLGHHLVGKGPMIQNFLRS